jgi:hypothetical protein
MTTFRRAPESTGAHRMPRTLIGSPRLRARAGVSEVVGSWRRRSAVEVWPAKDQLKARRSFNGLTEGVIGVRAAVDKGELVVIKSPVNIGTDDRLSPLYSLGAGGPTGTGEWTPMDGGYHPSQEGHTETGDQVKWVLCAVVSTAAIMMLLFDAMMVIPIILVSFLFGEPRLLARLAALRTRTMSPRWTMSGRRPWAEGIVRALMETVTFMRGSRRNANMLGPLAMKKQQVEIVDAADSARQNPRRGSLGTGTVATELVGNVFCLGRRVYSLQRGDLRAPHSARDKLEGRLLGLGRQLPRHRAARNGDSTGSMPICRDRWQTMPSASRRNALAG